MPPAPRLVLRLLVAALLHLAIGQARILAAPGLSGAFDMIVLGDESSERGHAFSQTAGELIQGGLGEPARRLLPLDPVSHNGGSIRFTLKIDPERQNYVTVKLWGSDHGIEKGRLLLFMDDTLQVGSGATYSSFKSPRQSWPYTSINSSRARPECNPAAATPLARNAST